MDRELLHQSLEDNLQMTFARSGGKGGQNVNKVNTKVHAFIMPSALKGLTTDELTRLYFKMSGMINEQGYIFIDVQDQRTQLLNREIALDRLESKIVNAIKVNKKRIKTKPTKASREQRLQGKKRHSEIKKNRSFKIDF